VSDNARPFYAYAVADPRDLPLKRAPVQRDWMEVSRGTYRCLPLAIANQSGWLLHSPATFYARWNGGPARSDLWIGSEPTPLNASASISVWAGAPQTPVAGTHPAIKSHFGLGVLTFGIPYVFRTPPGINLWLKGPSNYVKDGACALEGVVETDWTAFTFTMNWKLTRPGLTVKFERGEPIGMLVPIPRGLAESLEPRLAPIDNNPELAQAYDKWMARRTQSLRDLDDRPPSAGDPTWEKDYFQGRTYQGTQFEDHQTHLSLKEFAIERPTTSPPGTQPQGSG